MKRKGVQDGGETFPGGLSHCLLMQSKWRKNWPKNWEGRKPPSFHNKRQIFAHLFTKGGLRGANRDEGCMRDASHIDIKCWKTWFLLVGGHKKWSLSLFQSWNCNWTISRRRLLCSCVCCLQSSKYLRVWDGRSVPHIQLHTQPHINQCDTTYREWCAKGL